MESIHHLIKIIPKLAELTEPLRPLLKKQHNKNNCLNWNETHSKTFDNIIQKKENKLSKTNISMQQKKHISNATLATKFSVPFLSKNMKIYGTQ